MSGYDKQKKKIDKNFVDSDADSDIVTKEATQAFINLVAPGAHFENQLIYHHLETDFGLSPTRERYNGTFVDIGNALEDENYYGLAQTLRLLMAGQDAKAEYILLVNKAHSDIGYLPDWLGFLRDLAAHPEESAKKMESRLTGNLDTEDYMYIDIRNLPSAFWAILRKYPDQKIINRLEVLRK